MKIAVAALPSGDGRERPRPDRQIDDRHREHDSDIAADDQDREPQRDAIDEADIGQRQDDERGDEEQLVGGGIQPGAQLALLSGGAGREAVEQIGEPGEREHQERPAELAVERENHERRDQQHAKQRQLVRNGEDVSCSRAGQRFKAR